MCHDFIRSGKAVETVRAAEQREADRIEYCGFPRSRRSGDRENAAALKDGIGQIDLPFSFQRGEIFETDLCSTEDHLHHIVLSISYPIFSPISRHIHNVLRL